MIQLVRFFALVLILNSSALAYAQLDVRLNSGNRAATAGESWARGMADVNRSRGQQNLANSEAAINYTEVRSRELDNRLKTADTYFAMKNVNRSERFGTTEDRQAKREYNQQRFYRHGQEGKPKGLTSDQLDPITGKINWPFSLMPAKFELYRETLDRLFERRAQNGGHVNYAEFTQIESTTDDLLAALKNDIKKMSTKDYMNSKRFINELVKASREGQG